MTPRSRRRVAGLLLVGALAGASPTLGAASPSIDYIYVDAGEGGSSGGHAGLRIGEFVYHFEFVPPGLVRLRRQPFERFARQYTLLENRTMQISRIPISGETYTLMRDHFRRRYAIQVQHFDALDAVRADRDVIQLLLAGARDGAATPTITIDEAGYFAPPDPGRAAGSQSPALLALRERLAAAYGYGFVDSRGRLWRQRLADLDPRRADTPSTALSDDRPPSPTYGFAQRYRDALGALAALEILQKALPLAPAPATSGVVSTTSGAASAPGITELALEDGDASLLESLTLALEDSLVRLAGSSRPDWGSAFLVGMARLAALEKASASGRWVFLDPSRRDPPIVARHRRAIRSDVLATLLTDARAAFAEARLRLGEWDGAGFPESDFVALEAAGNRLGEMLRAVDDGGDGRVHDGAPAPAGAASVPAPVPAGVDEPVLRASLAAAMEREEHYVEALRGVYRYHLVTRNCVTEIFREIDRALASTVPVDGTVEIGPLVRAASQRRLGGYVDGGATLNFVPAVSAVVVDREYPVAERIELPAHRRARLARMYAEEPSVLVFLRESNTLTSTVYRHHPEDSFFLFFTDDVIVPRPLFGVANFLTGLGATAVGVVTLPRDGGRTLWAGVRGMIFSLPELFFFNIRKGSFDEADARPETTRP